MELPSIQIQSVHGKIGLQSQRPPLQIKQPNADLSIHQEHVDTLKISRKASKLSIDQTEAFADAHLKGGLRSFKEFLAKTEQKVSQYMQKKASEANQLLRIENGGDVIPGIAAQNSELYPRRELNVAQMPKPFQVKVDYQPSELEFQVSRSEPEISVTRREPMINIPKWQTDAYVRQKNQINIQVVGLQVNQQF